MKLNHTWEITSFIQSDPGLTVFSGADRCGTCLPHWYQLRFITETHHLMLQKEARLLQLWKFQSTKQSQKIQITF